MATPTREEIIKGLGELQAAKDNYTFDTYFGGFKLLNPRFAELETIINAKGGAIANPVKDLFTQAFNDEKHPEIMNTLIKISEDPAKMDKFIDMMKTNQGNELITTIMSYSMTGSPSGLSMDGLTTPDPKQFEVKKELGFVDIATKAGLTVRPNPVDTPGKALGVLGVLAAPVAIAELPAIAGATRLSSVFTAARGWIAKQFVTRPVTTGLTTLSIADEAATGGKYTGATLDWVGKNVLGEKTYAGVKSYFNTPATDKTATGPDAAADAGFDFSKYLPVVAIAAAGLLAYNLLSKNLPMVIGIATAAFALKSAFSDSAAAPVVAPEHKPS
ncbi:MAG TPA: hypothetical protein P5227_12335 [Emcibacteraceae bacterium]|nr:hypothetical protein [Emcibacteraceae bacterium]